MINIEYLKQTEKIIFFLYNQILKNGDVNYLLMFNFRCLITDLINIKL
jgi:hypothetical protein